MYKKGSSGHKQAKTWLSKKEYNKLISDPYLPRQTDLMIQLLYSCAFRVSEMINIRVNDVNFENATICIRESKTSDTPALVPVPPLVLKMTQQWITDNKLSPTKHLFYTTHSKKISRTTIHNQIKKEADRIGIKTVITTHTFRRSRATHLLDAGLPLEKVSQLLRHKHMSSTLVYLKLSIKGLQNAINEIDETVLDY